MRKYLTQIIYYLFGHPYKWIAIFIPAVFISDRLIILIYEYLAVCSENLYERIISVLV